MSTVMRQHAEQQFAEELAELAKHDTRPRPANWLLSPWAVLRYLMGGRLDNGFEVSTKYIGNERLMEVAVATLATDRALLLYGVPGTAKSWVSEQQCKVMDECLQLFGGYGYMLEYPIAELYVDARVQRIYGGTNEIMKELASRSM